MFQFQNRHGVEENGQKKNIARDISMIPHIRHGVGEFLMPTESQMRQLYTRVLEDIEWMSEFNDSFSMLDVVEFLPIASHVAP